MPSQLCIRPGLLAIILIGAVSGHLIPPLAAAQGCPEPVGVWARGTPLNLTTAGDFAYFGSGPSLLIADISDPTAPFVVGEVAFDDVVRGIAVVGSHAYVTVSEAGLAVVDVTDPAAPVSIGAVDTPGAAQDVAVSGTTAFVADTGQGLRVIDVTTPATPTEIGHQSTPGSAHAVVVSGTHAFVADGSGGLRLIDVSTPAVPVEAASQATYGSASDIEVVGDLAYVADGSSGMLVIDVSDPLGSFPVAHGPSHAIGITVSGGFAYIAGGGTSGLQVFDVRVPSSPVEWGTTGTAGWAHDTAVSSGLAFVADDMFGIGIFDDCVMIFADGFESGVSSAWTSVVRDAK
jgi:hypothetical protein